MKSDHRDRPLIETEDTGPELSFRALFVGLLLAAVLGSANAYLGLKAGMTVAATFPAAVIALAAFRLPFMRGGILEQNIARTTATVGEALVAAAIFTVPAFLIARVNGVPVWETFDLNQSILILGVGGVLGILFIIVMRRTLLNDANLPFPESYACFEIVRAGEMGGAHARYVFGALGLGALLEFFKNFAGIPVISEVKKFVLNFNNTQGISLASPLASPAIISVGYIIGPRYAGLAFIGGTLAWLVFVPLVIIFIPDPALISGDFAASTEHAWSTYVRPMAVGAMFVASLYTLWTLKSSIVGAFRSAAEGKLNSKNKTVQRLERDLNIKACFLFALILTIPIAVVNYSSTKDLSSTLLLIGLTLVLGFFLAIIGGWLCGLVGSSNQPVSGLTITAIIISAPLMLISGATGTAGVVATLTIAVIVCAAAALSGTLIQELKVGQLIGATPWKMQLAQIIGTVVVAFFAIYPMVLLHESTIATNIAAGLPPIGIGGRSLPAPQAALMAQVATAIMGGKINWEFVLAGMGLSSLLIILRIPGPMVVAVGMYLSFSTSAAIFVGGLLKWLLDKRLIKRLSMPDTVSAANNKGVLLASGLIAGEAIAGVILAGVVMLFIKMGDSNPAEWGHLAKHLSLSALIGVDIVAEWAKIFGDWLMLGVFLLVAYILTYLPKH